MENRDWMYARLDGRGALNSSFVARVDGFLAFSCSQVDCMSAGKVKCPCRKCKNWPFNEVDTVRLHLFKHGFVDDYFVWKYQGESNGSEYDHEVGQPNHGPNENLYERMVLDAVGPTFG